MATEITSATFDAQVIDSQLPTLVDFYADWCGPCRSMGPAVSQLAEEYAGRANVFKVNVDNNPDIAQRYGVMSIPMFAFIKDGKLADSALGAQPKTALAAKLDALL